MSNTNSGLYTPPLLRVSEVAAYSSKYLGHEVSVEGYCLSPRVSYWKPPRRRKDESEIEWLSRTQRVSPSVRLFYLVDLEPSTDYDYDDRYQIVDERPKLFFVNKPVFYLSSWRVFWPVLSPFYRIFARPFSRFTNDALRIDAPTKQGYETFEQCLERHEIPPWLASKFRYKFPGTITGTLERDNSPDFRLRLSNISRIYVPEYTARIRHASAEINFP